MAAGIAVIGNDGTDLTYGRMFLRWFGYSLSALPLGLGYLCAAFTRNNRALHDYVAGTRVVRIKEIGGGAKAMLVLAAVLFWILGAARLAMTAHKLEGMRRLAEAKNISGRLAAPQVLAPRIYSAGTFVPGPSAGQTVNLGSAGRIDPK